MKRKFWINAALIAAAWAGPCLLPAGRVSAQVAPASRGVETGGDVERLVAAIGDAALPQAQRDEAAREVASLNADASRAAIVGVLTTVNPEAQAAMARGLVAVGRRDDAFKNPLFALLRGKKAMADAAGAALAMYAGESDVVERLVGMAESRGETDVTRAAAARALGASVEKSAAQALVGLLDDPSAAIRTAAAEGLGDMSGLQAMGRDAAGWRQWWRDHSNTAEDAFRTELRNRRLVEAARNRQRLDQLNPELQSLLGTAYQKMPEAQKGEMLVRYLQGGDPAIRLAGARIFYDDAISGANVPAAAREQMRKMVGDSSAEVRLQVVGGLSAVNDTAAMGTMIAQLRREPDAEVRVAIANALARFGDLAAVPALDALLADSSPAVSTTAAKALQALAPKLREKDPGEAAKVAEDIFKAMQDHAGAPGAEHRETYVEAMAPFRNAALLDRFKELVNGREKSDVRKSALHCLGELQGVPRAADVVIDSGAIQDPDPTIRLEAVKSLNLTATFASAETLYNHSIPSGEPNEQVRDAAWGVLKNLFPQAGIQQLVQWDYRFRSGPAQRRLDVLMAMRDYYMRAKDEERLAWVRQNIGDTLMELKKPDEAVAYLQPSLDYRLRMKADPVSIEALTMSLMDALLASREYPKAVQFAAQRITDDPAERGKLSAKIRNESERLRNSQEEKDWRSGIQLIDEAMKMNPPLQEKYAQDLSEFRGEMQQKLDVARSRTPNPQGSTRPSDLLTQIPDLLFVPA